jgi:hypothetical protein
MTLAEAIAIADREYGDLVHSFRIDKEAEHREIVRMIREHDAICAASCYPIFVAANANTPPETMVPILIRFGMRVQEILQRPETSVRGETRHSSKEQPK